MNINLKSIFFFNAMLTPKLIIAIYWLLLAITVIGGISQLFHNFFYGIGAIIGGSIIARIWCELMIVLFKINENLQKIADKNVE
ncbi:DUF4282 domain-containing protein [Shewanella sp. NFH-SH190041]|uniref:DUF4282 domain-containing protein n=1 Tax=Shewanella sp. NFH-SH190041 TaxID=2950245 RepID=UPI0021C2FAB0|nr:DUF4282 domain-containing protein [Shewanella sp. NFH-SH190041]